MENEFLALSATFNIILLFIIAIRGCKIRELKADMKSKAIEQARVYSNLYKEYEELAKRYAPFNSDLRDRDPKTGRFVS